MNSQIQNSLYKDVFYEKTWQQILPQILHMAEYTGPVRLLLEDLLLLQSKAFYVTGNPW